MAENVHREQPALADRSSRRAAFVGAEQEHAGRKRDRCQRVDGRAEQLAFPFGRDDGDAGWKRALTERKRLGSMVCMFMSPQPLEALSERPCSNVVSHFFIM